MKLIIDRAKWLRGEGSEDSYLVRASDGKMCCLGFYGQACGLDIEAMRDVPSPAEVPDVIAMAWKEGRWLFDDLYKFTSASCSNLMEANDVVCSDFEEIEEVERQREAEIVSLFAFHSVEVEFVG